jgi:hypothetical protein
MIRPLALLWLACPAAAFAEDAMPAPAVPESAVVDPATALPADATTAPVAQAVAAPPVAPDSRTIRFILRTGRVVRGRKVSENAETISLQTATGSVEAVRRSEISSMELEAPADPSGFCRSNLECVARLGTDWGCWAGACRSRTASDEDAAAVAASVQAAIREDEDSARAKNLLISVAFVIAVGVGMAVVLSASGGVGGGSFWGG